MKRKLFLALALAASVFAGGSALAADASQTVKPASARTYVAANPANFTGSAWFSSDFLPANGSRVYGGIVTFAPGARTHWHIHPTRQVLLVTEGRGYVQEWGKEPVEVTAGDVIECPAGVKHWHGAAKDSPMSHFAIGERVDTHVEWLEEVEGIKN